MSIPKIVILGTETQAGTYVLRIRLKEDKTLRFGGFKKGKLISLPKGDYTYIGSALSEKGSTSLARRLVRHATRCGDKPPHRIRTEMIGKFSECGLGPPNPTPINGKTLYWNIDHMLDLMSVEVLNVLIIRSSVRLENAIASFLENSAGTRIIEKSLGANDAPRYTHILYVKHYDAWWVTITKNIEETFCSHFS